MKLKRHLLAWLLGTARPALWALPPMALWVLFCHAPLSDYYLGLIPLIVVFLHSMAIVSLLGRPNSASGAFLYGRGFSRDTLWAHQMLASVLAALAVWLPAALLIWTPVRAAVQDHLFQNPLFPLIAPREALVPWLWLAGYGLLLPTFHYAWIRQAQPVRTPDAGVWLALMLVLVLVLVIFTHWNAPSQALLAASWFRALLWVSGTLAALSLLIAGRRLHRELEVLP